MRSLFYLFLFTTFISPFCLAQKKNSKHTVQFKIYTWFDESQPEGKQPKIETLYFPLGKKMLPIQLKRCEVSPEYKTTIGTRFSLFKKVKNDKEEDTYQPVASVKIPPTLKKAFIYVFPFKEKIKLLAVDTSLHEFPKGSILLMNGSRSRILGTINGKTKIIETKKRSLFRYKLSKKGTVRFVIQSIKNKKTTNRVVMTVGGRKDQRIIAFLYQLHSGQYRLLLERNVDDQSIKIPVPE